MGQIRYGCATTTHAVRAAIQRSEDSLARLSKEFGVNPKTIAKWRKRQSVEDYKTGSQKPKLAVLSGEEEAMIGAFRRHTLLAFAACNDMCLPQHGFSRLPDIEGSKEPKKKFKSYPIG